MNAHTPNDAGNWHGLNDHLAGTAALARRFGAAFGAGEMAEAVGWLHDIGKCSDVFQAYLKTCEEEGNAVARTRYPSRDHKTAGALLVSKLDAGQLGPVLGTAILGHHGGMPDFSSARATLAEAVAPPDDAVAQLELPTFGVIDRPVWLDEKADRGADGRSLVRDMEMYLRFVFSCLVDADWLDTEAHFSPATAAARHQDSGLDRLVDRYVGRRRDLLGSAPRTELNRVRGEIYDEVSATVDLPPGLYQLATPTGSGKTLLGLGWALQHARANGLRRIVTAIPYISVTDQVTSVYRDFLDDPDGEVVLEHHSQVLDGGVWQRLAAENWGAPVVVTTTVRLFDALFSNRPSDCRRLHRLAGSVIVVDEVQALPLELLDPIVDALRSLVGRLGASVLLMTATQPTLQHVPSSGGVCPFDLLPHAERFNSWFDRTERTMVGAVTHAEAAELVAENEQCLCVVNSIADAIAITTELNDPEALHLTTRLRPADRRDRLQEVVQRLLDDSPCRLIATQLVEAGVDLDFPVVMRAVAPLPSLLQAEGRCNRNGLLPGKGSSIVFDLVGGRSPGGCYYRIGAPQTLVSLRDASIDPWSSAGIDAWYSRVLADPMVRLDAREVQRERERFAYRTVAELFHMIDDDTVSVVVPWPEDDARSSGIVSALDRLRLGEPVDRRGVRILQDATISLRSALVERCVAEGLVARVGESTVFEWLGLYDQQIGIVIEAVAQKQMIW